MKVGKEGPEPHQNPAWGSRDSITMIGITLAGGLLRLLRVGDPEKLVFDETYYAKDACYYAKASLKLCRLEDVQSEVHPPLGKWLIASGIKVFGFDSVGYRIASVIAGAVTILLLYLLARRMFGSTVGAAMAAGLLAVDPLHFVQSRTAMLDIFVPLFAVAAFLFAVMDRERLLTSLRAGGTRPPRYGLLGRPWRLAAGAAAGAALASKWSGGFVALALIALTFTWETGARRRQGHERPLWRTVREETLSIVLSLILLPLVIYTASYTGRGLEGAVLSSPWTEESWLNSLWDEQVYMFDFHSNLDANHPYQSPPWSWMLLKRPVSYYYEGADADGDVREILATGSPFVWWISIPALVYLAFIWFKRRNIGAPEGLILAGFLFSYGPWLVPTGRSAVFLFYFVATVPFMCLALAYFSSVGPWRGRVVTAVVAAGAVGFFAFFYPILTKGPLQQADWEKRIWFRDDCEQPKAETAPARPGEGDEATAAQSDSDDELPPSGWCWV